MNSKQRRKARRAHPERYWTQDDIDEVKREGSRLYEIFGGEALRKVAPICSMLIAPEFSEGFRALADIEAKRLRSPR